MYTDVHSYHQPMPNNSQQCTKLSPGSPLVSRSAWFCFVWTLTSCVVISHFSNEMILHINVFCLSMEHWILCQLYSTLTITMQLWHLYLDSQICYQSTKPNCLFACFRCCNIFSFCSRLCNAILQSRSPRHCTSSQHKDLTWHGSPLIQVSCIIWISVPLDT